MIYRPKCIHVRIASGCNLGCTFCERELLPLGPGGSKKRNIIQFVDGREDLDLTKDMDLSTWENVKTKLFPFVDRVELGGLGEPTLGKLFARAASDVVEAQKQLFFFTNGHFLDKDHVLDSVGETPHVSVSLDAGTPEVYTKVRKGNFDKALRAVEVFRQAKPHAKMDSQFTGTLDNIEDLPAWVKLCGSLGIGRYEDRAQLVLTGADHHVSDRIAKSLRFAKDVTTEAIDKARREAERLGLWFVAMLNPFSQVNPNAAVDGSDPRGIRRFSDLLLGEEENPCIISVGSSGGAEAPLVMPELGAVTIVGREMYVDYSGSVWTCLGRHVIGDVNEKGSTWESIVDENEWYQNWLQAWHEGKPTRVNQSTCGSCPRRK